MVGDLDFSCPSTLEAQRKEVLRLIKVNEERQQEIIKLKADLYRANMELEYLRKERDDAKKGKK